MSIADVVSIGQIAVDIVIVVGGIPAFMALWNKLKWVETKTDGIVTKLEAAKDLQRVAEVGQASAEGREIGRAEVHAEVKGPC